MMQGPRQRPCSLHALLRPAHLRYGPSKWGYDPRSDLKLPGGVFGRRAVELIKCARIEEIRDIDARLDIYGLSEIMGPGVG